MACAAALLLTSAEITLLRSSSRWAEVRDAWRLSDFCCSWAGMKTIETASGLYKETMGARLLSEKKTTRKHMVFTVKYKGFPVNLPFVQFCESWAYWWVELWDFILQTPLAPRHPSGYGFLSPVNQGPDGVFSIFFLPWIQPTRICQQKQWQKQT